MKKKVLIIDNYDSFTYILKQYFGELGGNPEVYFNDKITVSNIKKIKPTHIVLSPGPGTVNRIDDVGIMFEIIKEFYKKIPILGICLGHQAIGKFFGASIVHAPKIMHGKRSDIYHNNEGIFEGINNPFEAMRYHSLTLEFPISNFSVKPNGSQSPADQFPRIPLQRGNNTQFPISNFQNNTQFLIFEIARSDDDVIMGIRHRDYPVFGVQFHPESLGTKDGKKIIYNFLKY